MRMKKVTAFFLCMMLVFGEIKPIEVLGQEAEYTVDFQNATYYLDEFNGNMLPDTTGTGKTEIVIDKTDRLRVLKVTDEVQANYTIPGSTVLWDGESISDTFSGEGTEMNPYLVKSGADLKLLQETVNGGETYSGKYFKLLNNIDLQNYEWKPIGNTAYAFDGIFDGNHNKVSNVSREMMYSDGTYVGFFGKVSGSIINFGIENVKYAVENGSSNTIGNAGGFVGYLTGTIDNCYVRNVKISNTSTTKSISCVGGFFGSAIAGATVQNSYVVDFRFDSSVTNAQDKIGCLGGYLRTNNGKAYVYNCYVAGKFTPDSKLPNYYALCAVEKNANAQSGNNYCAHGVETHKTNLTQVEVKYETVTASKMGKLASDLGESFVEDETELINQGFPYHKNECTSIPDEAILKFDIDFDTADEMSFKLINTYEEVCVEETITNTYSEGWHSVWIDLQNGKYLLYVDGHKIKQGNALDKVGHSAIVFEQKVGMSYKIDNISIEKDYQNDLSKVADALMEEFLVDIDIHNITGNLAFYEIYNGYSVLWDTSDKKTISGSGEVTRRAVDLPVTITAQFFGNSSASIVKPFAKITLNVNVKAKDAPTDEEKVNDIVNFYLKDSILTDENLDSITKDLNALPTEYAGATINWTSSNTEIIANDGTVTLPETDGTDEEITITATVTLGNISKEVSFELVVTAPLSDKAKLQLAINDLTYRKITVEDINAITKDLTLPTKGLYGSTITWSSNNKTVISDEGIVTRTDKDTFVELSADFELNDRIKTKTYFFNVLMSDSDCATSDLNAISIPSEVTEDFTLVIKGTTHASKIEWTSNNDAIEVAENIAKVTRPENSSSDVEVTLTATASYGEATISKEFTVKVIKMESDTKLVDDVYDSINWTSISAESIDAVTNNLSLKTEYAHGINVSWESTPIGAVSNSGIIERAAVGNGDTAVKLTATITLNEITRIKEFDITIKEFASDEEAIQKATEELVFSELTTSPIDCVTEDLNLPDIWRYGSSITWSSSAESIISVSSADRKGYAHFPAFGEENNSVILTAEITLGSLKRTKEFRVTLAEPDGEKVDFFIDMEKYDIGLLSSVDNITVNKAYVGTEIVEDPINSNNKAMLLTKDSTFQPSNQKGTQVQRINERYGLFDLTMKLNFKILSDKNFMIFGVFGTGEEIKLSCAKAEDGVKIAGKVMPYDEWFDLRIEFDTYELVYNVYINDEFLKSYDFGYKNTKTAKRGLARIYFDFVYNSASGNHAVYVDDIKLTKKIFCKDTLSQAANLFEAEFLSAQDIRNITGDLIIPEISVNETSIQTISSDVKYVTDDGIVIRPTENDVNVKFTAIYKNDYGSSRKSVFDLVVKSDSNNGGLTDEEIDSKYALEDINTVYDYIFENHAVNRITENIELLNAGKHDSVITYSSSDEAVITNNGIVTRPQGSDKEVTLTITATRNTATEVRTINFVVLKAAKKETTVVQSTGGGSGGGGGGVSSVATGGGLTIVPSQNTSSGRKAVFFDTQSHWAKDYIEKLYDEGIISGKAEGTFAPDDNITREEFITLLVKALEMDIISSRSNFTDVSDTDWFAPYVMTAFENNIVNGISTDKFGIAADISRQDMCVMVYNAMKDLLETSETDEKFADDGEIADYAKVAVYSLKNSGIVSGRGDNSFESLGTATRAEAARIIYSLRELLLHDER